MIVRVIKAPKPNINVQIAVAVLRSVALNQILEIIPMALRSRAMDI